MFTLTVVRVGRTCLSLALFSRTVQNLTRQFSCIEDPVLASNILVEDTELLALQRSVHLTIGWRQSKVLTFIDTLFSEEGITPMIHTIDTLIHTLERIASNHSALISVVSIEEGAGAIQEEEELAVSKVVAGGLAHGSIKNQITLPENILLEVAIRESEVIAPQLSTSRGDCTDQGDQGDLGPNHLGLCSPPTFQVEWIHFN